MQARPLGGRRPPLTCEYRISHELAELAVIKRNTDELHSPALGKTHKSTVKAAVVNHGLPNFYFHLVTGYSIIRAKGVQVGKADYLSSFLGF